MLYHVSGPLRLLERNRAQIYEDFFEFANNLRDICILSIYFVRTTGDVSIPRFFSSFLVKALLYDSQCCRVGYRRSLFL